MLLGKRTGKEQASELLPQLICSEYCVGHESWPELQICSFSCLGSRPRLDFGARAAMPLSSLSSPFEWRPILPSIIRLPSLHETNLSNSCTTWHLQLCWYCTATHENLLAPRSCGWRRASEAWTEPWVFDPERHVIRPWIYLLLPALSRTRTYPARWSCPQCPAPPRTKFRKTCTVQTILASSSAARHSVVGTSSQSHEHRKLGEIIRENVRASPRARLVAAR
jgi:hypothetical protein